MKILKQMHLHGHARVTENATCPGLHEDGLPAVPAPPAISLEDPCCFAYRTGSLWEENLALGPPHPAAVTTREWAPEEKWIDFCGFKVASPLGVAAGPLLSADWVELAARTGYDVLTYKTIRSHHHAGHGLPNILHLNVPGQLTVSGPATQVPLTCRSSAPGPSEPLAITNSFGMPSQGPDQLRQDIPRARAALRRGQLLVVSVTGTAGRPGVTFMEDLAIAAHLAADERQGGAPVVEINMSCPNVGSAHCALYQDPQGVEATVAALREELGASVPLLIKVGAFADADSLRHVLAAAERAGAAGVAGINGLSRQVEAADGSPALGSCRPSSGVCGDPIRSAGLGFVRQARQVIASEGLRLQLVGVGGVTQAEHAMEYLEAGADVVQAATGFMWKPTLGTDFQRLWAKAGFTRPMADGRGGRA